MQPAHNLVEFAGEENSGLLSLAFCTVLINSRVDVKAESPGCLSHTDGSTQEETFMLSDVQTRYFGSPMWMQIEVLTFIQDITLQVSAYPECVSLLVLDPHLNNCIHWGVQLLLLRGSLYPGCWCHSLCTWARSGGVPCLLRGTLVGDGTQDSTVLLHYAKEGSRSKSIQAALCCYYSLRSSVSRFSG